MQKNNYLSIFLLILIVLLINNNYVFAEKTKEKEILVLGEDLSYSMIEKLKKEYGIDYPIKELIISNKEEHEALGKFISAELITNKSMSSAHIKLLEEGSGINVNTKNINWVTEDMYINALATAGIKDAEINVIGPFPVSGTAALTGAMKAYEEMTGEVIPEEKKELANEEMVTTAKLSDEIGIKEAEKLIAEVKIFIIENDIKDEDLMRKAIKVSAKQMGIKISDENIEEIIKLMNNISKFELDIDEIKDQLGTINDKLDEIKIETGKIKGFLSNILNSIKEFFSNIFNNSKIDQHN